MVALIGTGGCTRITPEVLSKNTIAVMICCAVFFVRFPAFGSFDIILAYQVCVRDHFVRNTLQIFACGLNILGLCSILLLNYLMFLLFSCV